MLKKQKAKTNNNYVTVSVDFPLNVYSMLEKYASLSNFEDKAMIRYVMSEYLFTINKIFVSKSKHECLKQYHSLLNKIMLRMENILKPGDNT